MLRTRALSALVLVPVLLVALFLGVQAVALVLALVAGLAGMETFRLLRAAGYPSLALFGTAIAIALVLQAGFVPDAEKGLVLVAIGAVLAGVGSLDAARTRATGWWPGSRRCSGRSTSGCCRSSSTWRRPRRRSTASAPLYAVGAERGWILLLVLGVWSFDTGAYLVGSQIGRHKFLTHISPSKSIEGLVGGLIACTIVVALMLAGLGQPPIGAIVLGPLLGLVAQAGDLAESMLKRAAGAKDSGTLIPGHGGILDRIDSFLFAAPVVALYVLAIAR